MRPCLIALPLSLLLLSCSSTYVDTAGDWVDLFDGETLDGWFLHHGELPFVVRDGEIVGATAVDIPTRYLTTDEPFADFILELEMNNMQGENSGVQFRSVTNAPFYTGLTGYQLEVDPSEREWTGGIYFEGVGTWQHTPINNPDCTMAWRRAGWNKLRIEAKGEQMRTFVNETPCAYLFDEYLSSGHIGLQVHSIGSNPDAAEAETRWRNIRIKSDPAPSDFTPDDLTADTNSHLIDKLSPIEINQGWRLARLDTDIKHNWERDRISNPITLEKTDLNLLRLPSAGEPAQAAIPLRNGNYHLVVDLQFTPGTTGELTYPVTFQSNAKVTRCTGSYRINDDRSGNKKNSEQTQLMGALTGHIVPENMSEPDRPKRVLYGDAWRRVEIRVHHDKVEHWLNAVKVLEFTSCTDLPESASDNALNAVLSIDKGELLVRTMKIQD